MLHLGGVLFFIEVLIYIAIKPGMRWLSKTEDIESKPWYGPIMNLSCFVLGLGGSLLASWGLKLFTPELFVSQILMAIEATFIAVGGYEVAKHTKRVIRNGIS
jgi:hypothetical protein